MTEDPLKDYRNRIITGDAFEVLNELPPHSVDVIWSSPPYWNMRSYPGQKKGESYGAEDRFYNYISNTMKMFYLFEHVLKKTGTLWWNVGDCYLSTDDQLVARKNMALIPWKVAVAAQNNGWICRSVIAWVKASALPGVAMDRFSTAWEPLFLFAHPESEAKYFFNLERVRRPGGECKHPAGVAPRDWAKIGRPEITGHFAVQPRELLYRYLPAALPIEVCRACGNEAVSTRWKATKQTWGDEWREERDRTWRTVSAGNTGLKNSSSDVRDWNRVTTECGCKAETAPPVVLDPFAGSGTTCLVAKELGADFIGVEASEEVAKDATRRVSFMPLSVFDMTL